MYFITKQNMGFNSVIVKKCCHLFDVDLIKTFNNNRIRNEIPITNQLNLGKGYCFLFDQSVCVLIFIFCVKARATDARTHAHLHTHTHTHTYITHTHTHTHTPNQENY